MATKKPAARKLTPVTKPLLNPLAEFIGRLSTLPGTLERLLELPKKLPTKLGDNVDYLYQVRATRLSLQRQAEELSKEETRVKEHLEARFGKDKLNAVSGELATLSIKTELVPSVKSWDKAWAWIKKNNADYLLRRQLNDGAYRELRELKKRVPGVEDFNAVKYSLTKRG